MEQYSFKIDGIAYDVFVPEEGIKRGFSVTDTDNAGRAINGDMIRDIIGTFYNYTIDIYPKKDNPSDYWKLYNLLSAPKEYYELTVPFNGGWLMYKAYITNGQDVLKTMKNGNKWRGLSVNFISMTPQWKPDGILEGYFEE